MQKNTKTIGALIATALAALLAKWNQVAPFIGLPSSAADLSFWANLLSPINLAALVLFLGGIISLALIHKEWLTEKFTFSIFSRRVNRLPLTWLRDEAKKREWEFEGQNLHILDFTDALRQAGLDGELIFWGRPNRNSFESLTRQEPLHKIPPNFWQDFDIDGISLWMAEDNFVVRAQSGWQTHKKEEGYVDIHIDAAPALRWLKRTAPGYRGRRKKKVV